MNMKKFKQHLGREAVKSTRIGQVFAGTVASMATVFGVVNPAHAASFIPLGDLPGGEFISAAYGVSADGSVVVGVSHGTNDESQAVRWENGVLTGLGDLPGGQFSSVAYGVSADGSVIVGNGDSDYGDEAFRWENGVLTGLGVRPDGVNYYSYARGVSANGLVIVGQSGDGDEYGEAFRWESGVFTGLGYLPGGDNLSAATGVSADGSVVVGVSPSVNGTEAFRWENGVLIGLGDLPGGDFSSAATGVSADGSVVVGTGGSTNGFEAFRWENGVLTRLGDLPGGQFYSNAYGVSADGSVVVGRSSNADFDEVAFIWNSTDGMLSLQDVLTDAGLDLTGWLLYGANAISADGQTIVGVGLNPDGNTEGWIARLDTPTPTPGPTSVPEPGTTTALLTSLAGMGIAAYQKRKHKV